MGGELSCPSYDFEILVLYANLYKYMNFVVTKFLNSGTKFVNYNNIRLITPPFVHHTRGLPALSTCFIYVYIFINKFISSFVGFCLSICESLFVLMGIIYFDLESLYWSSFLDKLSIHLTLSYM